MSSLPPLPVMDRKPTVVGGGPVEAEPPQKVMMRRFTPWTVLVHAVLALSIYGLVFTGMPLKYPHEFWAKPLMTLWGGPSGAAFWHRVSAVLLVISGGMHLCEVAIGKVRGKLDKIFGPDTILPMPRDVRFAGQNIKYLLGRGERPKFGRFAYWEKFDYLAEVGGLALIGSSGLVMWFPELAARFLPGWIVNAALIMHSNEALLAAAFLFTIHFFNTHLRAESFPMDTVIFSGTLELEKVKHHWPGWYERLEQSGKLRARIVEGSERRFPVAQFVGAFFVALGLMMLFLIMWAAIEEVFRYFGRVL